MSGACASASKVSGAGGSAAMPRVPGPEAQDEAVVAAAIAVRDAFAGDLDAAKLPPAQYAALLQLGEALAPFDAAAAEAAGLAALERDSQSAADHPETMPAAARPGERDVPAPSPAADVRDLPVQGKVG